MAGWLAGPQAWLAGPQAWLAGPQAWLDGPEGGTYERTNGRKISPFYRTSSPIGAAAQKGCYKVRKERVFPPCDLDFFYCIRALFIQTFSPFNYIPLFILFIQVFRERYSFEYLNEENGPLLFPLVACPLLVHSIKPFFHSVFYILLFVYSLTYTIAFVLVVEFYSSF